MRTRLYPVMFVVALTSCKGSAGEDGRDDTFLDTGKGDTGGVVEGSPEARGVLAVANTVSLDILDANAPRGVGLSRRAVDNIGYFRLGDDGVPGTRDDGTFDSLAELDAIPFVGIIAFEQLLEYAIANGYVMGGPPDAGIEDAGPSDGGAGTDGGIQPDGGTGTDGGTSTDGGVAIDAWL